MRTALKDLTSQPNGGPKNAPLKMWSLTGPDWGNKMCVAHRFAPGADATPALAGLPDGLCPVPHWGYCVKGRLTVRYGDGTEEVLQAGDLFYWPAGHTFFTDDDAGEDCEVIEFSELADVEAMQEAMEDHT
jgi:cupin domain